MNRGMYGAFSYLDSGACPGPRSGVRRNDVNFGSVVLPAEAGIQYSYP